MSQFDAAQFIAGATVGSIIYVASRAIYCGMMYGRADSGFKSALPVAGGTMLLAIGFTLGKLA